MNTLQENIFVQSKFGLFLLSMITWSCSSVPAPPNDGTTTVINRTSQPLIFMSFVSESFRIIDPILSFPFNENQMTLIQIQPEESLSISDEEIDGDYSLGKDIGFLYTLFKVIRLFIII